MPITKCLDCYEFADEETISRFLCSRLGWTKGMNPCRCEHHKRETPLVNTLVLLYGGAS